jgi:hypothetical protein
VVAFLWPPLKCFVYSESENHDEASRNDKMVSQIAVPFVLTDNGL